MSVWLWNAIALLFVAVLVSCGGGGGGGDSAPSTSGAPTRGGATPGTGGSPGGGGGNVITLAIEGSIAVSPSNKVEIADNATSNNNSPSSAQPIAPGDSIAGSAGVGDAGTDFTAPFAFRIHDFYRVTVNESATIVLTIANDDAQLTDLDLYLFDSAGAFIRSAATATSTFEVLDNVSAGTYLLGVSAAKGSSHYVLSVETASMPIPNEIGVPSMREEIVPGEVLVKYKDEMVQSAALAAASHGLEVRRTLGNGAMHLRFSASAVHERTPNGAVRSPDRGQFSGDAMRGKTYSLIRTLKRDATIQYVEPNAIFRQAAVPNDASYALQWSYPAINLPAAWDITVGAPVNPADGDVIVAVVDSGILSGHPDLQGQMVPGFDFVSDPAQAGDGTAIDPNPEDNLLTSNFHGTHVAGTIAARSNNTLGVAGVAWSAKIMALRALAGGGGTAADISEAILYAAGLPNASNTLPARRADVLNMSFAAASRSMTMENAVRAAIGQGVIAVAAAGNDVGPNLPPPGPLFPAAYEGVIAVGAVGPTLQRAPYSNFGPTIDVAAPGGDASVAVTDGILSTSGRLINGVFTFGYDYLQGTSMASPHVAGVMALMKSVNRGLRPNDMNALLAGIHPNAPNIRITRDIGTAGRDDLYGHGLIDAFAAVQGARGVIPFGQPTGSQLLVTVKGFTFGATDYFRAGFATNSGLPSVPLTVTAVRSNQPWLKVTPIAGTAPLRLTVTTDRTGLAVGTYTGTITVDSDATQGPQSTSIPVTMTVSQNTATGNVGTVIVELIDAATGVTVALTTAAAADGYRFGFPASGIPAGRYRMRAGTDRDGDGEICEIEDACGELPDEIVYTGRTVSNRNYSVGHFRRAEPGPISGPVSVQSR